MRMMEQMLSKETFTKGLTEYLASNSYNSATEDDLFLSLEAAAITDGKWPQENGPDSSFSEVMKSWTNQAGVPLIHASYYYPPDGKEFPSLAFNQSWLVSNEATSEKRRWAVPLSFTNVQENPQPGWEISLPQAWIGQDQDSIITEPIEALSHDVPFVVNIQGTGYYRVNYDKNNWDAIADILKTNRDLIHPLNRAQIVCDVMALAETGHVSAEVKENILSYESLETDYAPLLAFERCNKGFEKEDDFVGLI